MFCRSHCTTVSCIHCSIQLSQKFLQNKSQNFKSLIKTGCNMFNCVVCKWVCEFNIYNISIEILIFAGGPQPDYNIDIYTIFFIFYGH
jgi:hypothetical protein